MSDIDPGLASEPVFVPCPTCGRPVAAEWGPGFTCADGDHFVTLRRSVIPPPTDEDIERQYRLAVRNALASFGLILLFAAALAALYVWGRR